MKFRSRVGRDLYTVQHINQFFLGSKTEIEKGYIAQSYECETKVLALTLNTLRGPGSGDQVSLKVRANDFWSRQW